MSDGLSWQRLGLLLRNDLKRSYRSALVVSGTLALLALASPLIGVSDYIGSIFYQRFFIAVLFIWGTIATSLSFADLHGRTTNTAFLLLPASALEKTAARLLVNTVLLIAYLLVYTTVLSWLIESINAFVLGIRRDLFSPFDRLAWSVLPHYLVAQALFFLGAAWFRKAQYVKTVGAAAVVVFGLCAVAIGVMWLVGLATWGGGGLQIEGHLGSVVDRPLDWLLDVVLFAYYFALPPLCWFVAWLRVTETQVSHGI